ncbi:MAG: polyprenyl synthetase family protein [Deltaproteobacteria bacterium]
MKKRIEGALSAGVARATDGAPPTLAEAIRYAVFPGGARVRPHLCLAVASACGDDRPRIADAAACSIELLHCASLVHDDLPCFDDAATRRGKASVHCVYGEAIALLVGDALIVQAYECLAGIGGFASDRLPGLLQILTRAAGSPNGLVAGQAWESEPHPDLETYHRAKTGALFVASTMAGAVAAGREGASWRLLGERLGEAYQVADDLLDAVADPEEANKPVLQDTTRSRPSAVLELGVYGALAKLRALVDEAVAAIPDVPGAEPLRQLVRLQAKRLVPKALQTAA